MSIQLIYSALISAGMTPEGACGLMGNMQAESAMRSNNVEDRSGISDADYTARVDNDPNYDFANDGGRHYGYGLCQWTLASRKSALLAYARSKGRSIGDEEMQVHFCIKEMQTDFPEVWKLLVSSHDLYECTSLVCAVYENPAVKNTDVRYGFAKKFYDELADQVAMPGTPPKGNPKDWDWKIALIQFCMQTDGYWGEVDGVKSGEFIKCLEEYVKDIKIS